MYLVTSNLFQHPGFIVAFATIIIVMLIIDLGFFNKEAHKVSNKEALIWSVVWIGISLCFGLAIYLMIDGDTASQFLTAFLIEKALSVDNLFVFILVFKFFKVKDELHHKVLFWGIVGAIVMRAIFIFSGVALIEATYLPPIEILGAERHINVVLTLFGIFLIYAGIKSGMEDDDDEEKFGENVAVRVAKKLFPVSKSFDGEKFFTIENGKRLATPLLLVVVVVELTDLMFAVDSIPAIFAVSKDPFILYTSNIFAILGLRSLYFLLANFMQYFKYLKYGLAFILSFIGIKMLVNPFYHISSPVSLTVVALTLVFSTGISIFIKDKTADAEK